MHNLLDEGMNDLLFLIGYLKKLLHDKELTQEEMEKVWRDNLDKFVEAYAQFKVFHYDYEKYRDDQNGYLDDAKYPWGYKRRFDYLESYLCRFATGRFLKDGIPPIVWDTVYSDIEYSLNYYMYVKRPQAMRAMARQLSKELSGNSDWL